LGFRNMEIVKLEIFTQVKIHIVFFWLWQRVVWNAWNDKKCWEQLIVHFLDKINQEKIFSIVTI
jgi:hypothetical protein